MANLTPFLAYVFVTTFTPGPNNIMAMSNGLRYGYKKTLAFIGGVFIGFVVVLLLSSLLNYALLSLLPQVKFWMNILGVAYMIFLAVHIAFSKPIEEGSQGIGLNTIKAGFLMQFINLKGILYSITVFSNFIIPLYGNSWSTMAFAPLLAFICVISTSCWAIGGDIFRRFLNRYNRIFNIAMGLLLVYTAVASLLER